MLTIYPYTCHYSIWIPIFKPKGKTVHNAPFRWNKIMHYEYPVTMIGHKFCICKAAVLSFCSYWMNNAKVTLPICNWTLKKTSNTLIKLDCVSPSKQSLYLLDKVTTILSSNMPLCSPHLSILPFLGTLHILYLNHRWQTIQEIRYSEHWLHPKGWPDFLRGTSYQPKETTPSKKPFYWFF